MKRWLLILAALLAISSHGCSDRRAEELFETAQLEELQRNPDHAREIYREIVTKYPDTDFAERAKERLSALGEGDRK